MESKKFYWLKLKRDFFKRHDIFIIEGMEDGMAISHFYIKLMLESVDHNGELRFNESIPYTPDMLSSITRMNIETVTKAIEVLKSFGLLQQTDDGTFILPKVSSMIDSASDTDGARRARRFREKLKTERDEMSQGTLQNVTDVVTKRNEIKSKSNRQIKSKSKSKSYIFVPPTLEEVRAYCQERNNNVSPERFFEYYEAGNWKDAKGNQVKNWKQKLMTWEKSSQPQRKPEPVNEDPFDKYIYGEDL